MAILLHVFVIMVLAVSTSRGYPQLYNYFASNQTEFVESRAGVECGHSVFHENLAKTTGSRLALPGEFPWQVTLHNSEFDSPDHDCSGAIISEYYILTAAHCLSE